MSEAATLYDSLTDDPRRKPSLKQSLMRIRTACDGLDKLGAAIEVSTVCDQIVATLGKKEGPTAGSIRNQKDTLLKYIYLRRAEQHLPSIDETQAPELRITDKRVADYVRLLEMRVKRAEGERDRATHLLKNLDPIAFDKLMGSRRAAKTVGRQDPLDLPAAAKDRMGGIAKILLSAETLRKLALELVELDGKLMMRSKYQHWPLLWEEDLLALAELSGLTPTELRSVAGTDGRSSR